MHARIVTFAIVLAAQRTSAAECPATAVLEGEGALVDSIDAQLARRGIATTPTADCPVAKARIERRGTAVTVIVTDPNGRRSERALADLDAAASLIESWARQDMNAAALLGWTEPAPVVIEPVDTVVTRVPITLTTRARDPVTLVAAGEASAGFDGTSWIGARATACVRIGPVCAGATARMLSNEPRRSYDALASIDLPIALSRRIVVLAGAGVGAGWFQAPISQGEAFSIRTTTGVRIDARAQLSVSLARYVALHAGISLGGSPQAPATLEADGDMPVLNGEPAGFVRGDLGLRIGAP
jgi:hypothetical protein